MRIIYSLMAALTLLTGSFLTTPDKAHASDFKLTSPDVSEGKTLSSQQVFNGFGCHGKNISPALEWSGAPEGTKSYVLTVYDPDAPTGSGFWHWIVFNLPASVNRLEKGAGSGKNLPDGAVQGRSDFGSHTFGGACPPPGKVHRYEFTIYALDVDKLDLDQNASAALIGFMTHTHSLDSAKITAVYNR